MTSNKCIYRYISTGRSCCFRTKDKYCNLHSNNRNNIYEIINEATDNNYKLQTDDIYKIYKYIYDNEKIFVKELIFKTFLKIIYNKHINTLIRLYPYLIIKNNKEIIYDKIYQLNKNTYDISKKLNENKIIKIQDLFRYQIIKDHIYNKNIENKINNNEDPFTFDNIVDINIKERFIYNDGINYYCFKALELLYFIETKENNWNPYTKKEFEPNIIYKLKLFIKYNKLIIKTENNNWTSVIQAYTDVSQSLEKIGFYNNTEWFLKLTTKQIKNIIRLYKIISVNDDIYFKDENIHENNIFFDFAREIIKLFEDGNSHFILCCNFIKALSIYSNDFYNNLPDWMSDIETPINLNINNRDNIFNRLLNNMEIIYLINIIDN
jgi:hypothetical protein